MKDVADLGCSGPITLSANGKAAEEWPGLLGRYVATGEAHEGAAVYRKSHEGNLYRHSDGTWNVCKYGIGGGSGNIRSIDTAECPASIRQWQYSNAIVAMFSGDIRAQCSVHT